VTLILPWEERRERRRRCIEWIVFSAAVGLLAWQGWEALR
jgi:hypothetical protein